jgi:hypothetical protein
MCFAAAIGFALVAVNTAYAQVSSIDSAFIDPGIFQPIIPGSVFSDVNSFVNPNVGSVVLTETGVTNAGGNGYADKDEWYFSADGGSSAYLFQNDDYFSATFSLTLTGGTAGKDIEAGWLFSNSNGEFPGSDLVMVLTGAGVVFQGGGVSYYPFSPLAGGYPGVGGGVSNYVEGETYTMGLNYVLDPKTGNPAFQFSVNGQFAASATNDTYFDLGAGVGVVGNPLGAYFQIQTATNNPTNSGSAAFTSISILPQMNINIAVNGNQTVLYYPAGATNFVVQTSTNLSSTNWTTVTNGTPITGIVVTNSAPAAYFRLEFQ